ncbi:MAG: HlyD family efflux transporter periplasmic adaptor subunit [Pseudomonadota bacterium]
MKIVRERPCSRRAYGVNAPLKVSVKGGQPIRAIEWSRLGIVLPAVACKGIPADQPLDLHLHLDFQGYEIRIRVGAADSTALEIERDDSERAFDFVEIDQRGEELLEHFIENIVRGRMSSVDDTILCLDTPIDSITTDPDIPKTQGAKKSGRPIWPFMVSGFYVVLGVVVAGYVGLLVYGNFIRMEVQTAVISRPIEVIEMPTDGILVQMATDSGAQVSEGSVIMRLHDPKLAQRIDETRIALNEAEGGLSRIEQRFEIESARLAKYQLISQTERDISSADVTAHEEEVETLGRAHKRSQILLSKGHVSEQLVEEAAASLALAQARLRSAKLMRERNGVLFDASDVRHHNGREFIVDLDLLRLDIAEARATRDSMAARLGALLEARADQEIRAPWRGRIVEVMHQEGARLLRGDPLIAIEKDTMPVVEAFLTQEEILEIGYEDEALIFLPSLNRKIAARVVRIDRTSGFVDEQRSQYTWRGPEDRSARVTLAIDPATSGLDALPAGLPAVTLFTRRDATVLEDSVISAQPDGSDV